MSESAKLEPEVRRSVRALLERSPAFRKLPDDERRKLASDMVAVGTTLAIDAHDERIEDLPAFVANLVKSTFDAIVDKTIEQMQAYGELLASLVESDAPYIHERLTEAAAKPSRAGLVTHKLKWPP